ncbi:MAG: FAD:protein FMN transferase [Bacteroidota bacterium]
MKAALLPFFLLFLGFPLLVAQDLVPARLHKKVVKLMGSRFEISAIHEDDSLAWQGIEAAIREIQRIESLISSWEATSETSQINAAAGKKAIRVKAELFSLIQRSLKISRLTQGAFDISYASMDKIWYFDGTLRKQPDQQAVNRAKDKIAFEKIILNEKEASVFLSEPGMKIGFGAIGKGYAANQARKVMMEKGIQRGLVNAGGDLICWGASLEEDHWTIGIADPRGPEKAIASLQFRDMAVVTSGNYEKYVLIDGQRFSHIIDPRTGYPVKGLRSVSVICPDAELADALATSVFVMGPEAGLNLINQLKGIEALLIDDSFRIITSEGIVLDQTGSFRKK